MYLIFENDTIILSLNNNNKESVTKALNEHFDCDFMIVSKICDNGTILFYEWLEFDYKIIEQPSSQEQPLFK